MYQNFFHLKQRPFSATPDPQLLYNSPSVRLSLNALELALRQGEGIGLLTAVAGTGKTLICKVLAERLAEDPFPVLLLNSNYPTRSALLQAILFELGRPYSRMTEQELRLELVASGRQMAETHTGIALIVDEAHLLGEHILEELRSLTNFMAQSRPIFRVMLSGQLSLEESLARRSLEALNQRLQCHVSLETLTRQESLEYIITRVEYAGGDILNLFTERALELIIHAADGLPRCLNQLCDHACLLASVLGDQIVQPRHVREALDDLQKLPLHWNTPLPAMDPVTEHKENALKRRAAQTELNTQQSDFVSTASDSEASAPGPVAPVVPVTKTPPQSELEGSRSTAVASTSVIEIGELPSQPMNQTPTAEVTPHFNKPTDNDRELETELREEIFEQMARTEAIPSSGSGLEEVSATLEIGAEAAIPSTVVEKEAEDETELIVSEDSETEVSEVKVQKPPSVSPPHLLKMLSAEKAEELIRDRYAALDARRLGQLDDNDPLDRQPLPRSSAARNPHAQSSTPVDDLEQEIGQTVWELCTEVSTALSEQDEDYVPDPSEMLQQPIDSASAKYYVVDPEPSHSSPTDYDRLYSELRKKARS